MADGVDLNSPEASGLMLAVKKLMLTPAMAGATGNDAVGFSDEEIKSTYAQACQQLQVGQIAAAAKLFGMLCALKHAEAKHWRGLGLCMHKWNMWPVAELNYSIALRHDPSDVVARVFLAEVQLKMNRIPRARAEAEQAIELGKRSTRREEAPYVKRAERLLQFIGGLDNAGQSFE